MGAGGAQRQRCVALMWHWAPEAPSAAWHRAPEAPEPRGAGVALAGAQAPAPSGTGRRRRLFGTNNPVPVMALSALWEALRKLRASGVVSASESQSSSSSLQRLLIAAKQDAELQARKKLAQPQHLFEHPCKRHRMILRCNPDPIVQVLHKHGLQMDSSKPDEELQHERTFCMSQRHTSWRRRR
ncbi:hypothetical protein AB1Y20_013966 [Prymnesium parvum]|uniref:Uncharacterized protein n=1 Tax=Prymnesium parvum TaxID=97485 RepID=A0AB34IFY6_PRYPA|mmetsp:Transcript_18717/g.28201  ORF Transcript_18717/g.28201 Transcript_18717/m.28201 type:complete len:184 (+) Transcript_18717:205-756(+)